MRASGASNNSKSLCFVADWCYGLFNVFRKLTKKQLLYIRFKQCNLFVCQAGRRRDIRAEMSGSSVIRGPAGNNDCRVYVGNLPPDIRTKDVEDVFYKYGAIRDIDLKNRRGGPPFAFVEFEDPRWVQLNLEPLA